MIDEVVDTLTISETIARALLIKFFWDKETLINQYYENDNLVRQLFAYDMNQMSTTSDEPFLCPVCYFESTETMGMECGHRLCYECYKQYLTS